ncbi:Uncharacterized protein FKW44_002402 [Caligus rogercresseyi]|uniref:Zinc finger MYM-type protein 1 n=1 Tax=Caligus rogercresseyi TaxID=217165 RepID=A0A7T8KK47_CALRO|nr:Uncharacterized protein FKW44_002402 [Caligus rogercresseyi]
MNKSRKRLYRSRVRCSNCGKEVDGDYKREHVSRVHGNDEQIKFIPLVDQKQKKLSFGIMTSGKTNEIMMPTEATSYKEESSSIKDMTDNNEHTEEVKVKIPNLLAVEAVVEDIQPTMDKAENNDKEHEPIGYHHSAKTDRRDHPHQPLLGEYNRKQLDQGSGTRDFNPDLFKKYPWASFDTTTKSIVCFPCQKFLSDSTFTYSNWKKPERLVKHGKSGNHRLAMSKWIISKVNKKHQTSVLVQLDTTHKDMVQKNRNYLKVIVESILYTAQQNIPQRGHEEDTSMIGQQSDINRGNLIELLHLRCKDIPWLANRLNSNLEAHRQWLSPEIQNEILKIASNLVLKEISKNVREAGKFSLIVDETSDVGNREQVAVCLRYVNNEQPTETFVGFYEAKSTTGETLFQIVLEVINCLELHVEDIVGQCYDGASNMTGKEKGVAKRIQEVSPKAIYVHCYGHRLNLALQDTLEKNTVIRNALGVIQSIHNFFNSPKRENVLRSVEMPADLEATPYIKLKSLSETRWSCRWEAVKAIDQQPERIIIALLKLSNNKDAKTSVDARGLVKAMLEFQFLLGLQTLKVIFSNTNSLARYLQGHEVDVITAKATCDATMKTLSGCRDEEMFSLVWEKAKKTAKIIREMASESDEDKTSRRKKNPSKRLQALVGEISEEEPSLSLIPIFANEDNNILMSLAKIVLGDGGEESFKLVSNFYNVDEDLLMAEAAIFHNLEDVNFKSANDIVKYLSSNSLSETLPHFTEISKTLATIPVTSCSAERSFSCLRRLKTYLRSTMSQERLHALGLLSIERHYVNRVDIDTIIDEFGRQKGRNNMFF